MKNENTDMPDVIKDVLSRLYHDIGYFDRDDAETDTDSIDYEHGNLCLTIADLFVIKKQLEALQSPQTKVCVSKNAENDSQTDLSSQSYRQTQPQGDTGEALDWVNNNSYSLKKYYNDGYSGDRAIETIRQALQDDKGVDIEGLKHKVEKPISFYEEDIGSEAVNYLLNTGFNNCIDYLQSQGHLKSTPATVPDDVVGRAINALNSAIDDNETATGRLQNIHIARNLLKSLGKEA